MKTLHYSIIAILILSTSLYLKPIQADDANGVKIENIQTLPSSIIIGETFKISATLVNNSSKPIFVDYGSCEAPFSVIFDNHVLVNQTHPICKLNMLEQKLNPGEKTIATSPSLDLVYRAAQNGTVNATITFPYETWNQTIQSNSNEIVSEPFSFTIYGKTRAPTLSPSGNQAIIDVALAIPGLQKWSNDWQYDSMAFMTAKNQPGNWQYAIVYLKASSSSSLIPCDNNNDWSAMVMIDRTTMKVIQATYPTMESHNCNYTTGGGPGTSGGIIPAIDAPLKQFKSGIAANDVKCNNALSLVIKAEDGSPACVSPVTSTKLILMGWGESLKDTTLPVKNIDIIGLQQNYTVGQPINVTISYTGYMSGGVYPDVEILDMNNSQVWSNCIPVHSETTMRFHYTATYNAQCGDAYPVINKTGTYTMIASLDNKTASAEFTIVKPLLLPASFEPCNTSYPNGTGIAVLYMPTNSTGKICVQYSNSNTPQSVNVRIFEAQRISQDTQNITVTADHDTVPTGNSIVAYTLKTTNQAGFYGFTIFCVGTPLAIGYDNSSTIVQGDFPWLGQMFMCPAQFYDYHIVGLNNIGVKYIQ